MEGNSKYVLCEICTKDDQFGIIKAIKLKKINLIQKIIFFSVKSCFGAKLSVLTNSSEMELKLGKTHDKNFYNLLQVFNIG